MKTFQEFQASRTFHTDLGSATPVDEYAGRSGYTYPAADGGDPIVVAIDEATGNYDLEWIGHLEADFETAELALYEFVKSEGLI